MELFFDKGTVVLQGATSDFDLSLSDAKWDARSSCFRAPAHRYRDIVLALRERKIPHTDNAKDFLPTPFPLVEKIVPRPFQAEALTAWREERRGVVVLPTGAGKTILAVIIIAELGRPTLIHVPTIDLMHQWYVVLRRYLDREIGMLGGGYRELKPITVATYDSALLHVNHKGNRYGLAIFDECHHLPSGQYQYTALCNIAPFRLGLTATPERNDEREPLLYELCGPLCYETDIHRLMGETLAPYEVFTIEVEMKAAEREEYEQAYAVYTGFLRKSRINMGGPRGWQQFIWQSSRTAAGREAFKAYLRQKQLSLASEAKDDWVWKLIQQHRDDRILIFTQDNLMAYRIGRRLFLPVLTHQTRPKEREQFLDAFRSGEYNILVTSKVLNEGVDVPEANVAIVVSGSGSVREHVQRLGRILRARPGKKAMLYELISSKTREFYINQRRKRHHAYQGPGSV